MDRSLMDAFEDGVIQHRALQ